MLKRGELLPQDARQKMVLVSAYDMIDLLRRDPQIRTGPLQGPEGKTTLEPNPCNPFLGNGIQDPVILKDGQIGVAVFVQS